MDENKNINPGEQRSEEPAVEPQQPAQPAQPAQSAQPQQPVQQPQQNYGHYGQTPPPQYAQRPQYGYQPQQPQQYAYVPAQPANRGKGGGWIGFLRVMAWILFAIMELTFIISGIVVMSAGGYINGAYYYGGAVATIFMGLMVMVVGTLMAFLMIAAINVSLDAAQNIRRTATNTAEMNEKLDDIRRRMK